MKILNIYLFLYFIVSNNNDKRKLNYGKIKTRFSTFTLHGVCTST
jgi:hypothetical protein